MLYSIAITKIYNLSGLATIPQILTENHFRITLKDKYELVHTLPLLNKKIIKIINIKLSGKLEVNNSDGNTDFFYKFVDEV